MPDSAKALESRARRSPTAIDVEILKGAVRAAQGEMESVLERTAMSPFIREKKDYFTGIHAADGRIVICTPIPFFGDLVTPIIEQYPVDTMSPGDIYWYNDCYGSRGAVSHSSDQVLFTPIFHDGRLVAMAQCWAHFADIGGLRPGSMSPDTTDIFQEGLIVPPMRLARDWVLNDDLLRLFERNSRFPKFIRGDVRAMVASIRLGERRVVELCERYGADFLTEAFDQIIGQSGRAIRGTMRSTFPPGRYSFTDWLETDGHGGGPFRLQADLTSDDSGITLDVSRSSDQAKGPVNVLMHPFVPRMMMGIYSTSMDGGLLFNDGCSAALDEVRLRSGSILQPRHPAPLGQRGITVMRFQTCLMGLVNIATGGKSMAASNSYALYYMRGIDSRTQEPFLLTDGVGVGYGARPFADGIDAVYLVAQKNYPAEFLEAEYPVRLLRYEVNCDSGGPGLWRGGCGVVREVEVLTDTAMLSSRVGGGDYPPWGVSGGKEAGAGRVVINPGRPDERVLPAMQDGTILRKGDIMRMETGGGGGWGHPFDRDPELVRRDVLGGFVSLRSALEDYGVVLTGPGRTIDRAATAARRKDHRETPALFHRKGYHEALN